jgi:LytS/YehU family sensor histidine kinase
VNAEENSSIRILININDDDLNLSVKNNKVTVERIDDNISGIGIENTRHRLEMIYPSNHLLTINNNEEYFEVLLRIHLK